MPGLANATLRFRASQEVVILIVLVSSAPLQWIAAIPEWGWDFRNIYLFHHCLYRDTPYAVAAAVCDPRWQMPFPPPLYASFAWTRVLAFPVAYAIWVSVIVSGLVATARLWGASWVLAIAFFFLFPTWFALATGNNDIAVVLLWSAAWLCWRRNSLGWAGVWAGLAAAFKLYPAVAVALVLVAIVPDRRAFLRFLGGAAVAVLAHAFILSEQWWDYAAVLERFVSKVRYPSWYSHAMPQVFGKWSLGVSGGLFVAWALAVRRSPAWLFAGALAISTFFGPTSHDYNLLTTYPLLARLWAEWRGGVRSAWWLLVTGLFAIGHRNVYLWTAFGMGWTAVLQLVWLVGVALVIALSSPTTAAGVDRGALPLRRNVAR